MTNLRSQQSISSLQSWLVCLSAGLFFFYEFFQLNLFDVINRELLAAFHINAAQLSWMSSAYLWANVLFLLPAGVILDRFSVRIVVLLALLLCVIGTICFALTDSFILAAFFHAFAGVGNAICFLSCVVLVSRWFPPQRQAFVIGCIVTMAFVGGMVAHTPLTYLNTHYGWRNAVLIDGIVGILFWFIIFFAVKDRPKSLQLTATHEKPQILQVLKTRQNWLAGLYASCLNLPIMVLCALWGASYLQAVHHVSMMEASNIISFLFIGSIIGCPLVGWSSDKMGRRWPLMVAGAITTLITSIILVIANEMSILSLNIVFFLLGLFSSTQVLVYPLVSASNPANNTGFATGIASILVMGGAGLGQVLFGRLLQYHASIGTQSYTSSDFQLAIWLFPWAAVIALLAIFWLRDERFSYDG